MRRFEAIQRIMEAVTDEIVVCTIGHPAQELYAIKDRPQNFYMLGSMGMASSIGLGLALSTSHRVIAIEGDGGILMNLGSLATIGTQQPPNYVLIIVDNESYGSTGFQPTCTRRGLRLDHVASACRIKSSMLITEEQDIVPTLQGLLASESGPHCLVIKAEVEMPEDGAVIAQDARTLRDRFMRSIAAL